MIVDLNGSWTVVLDRANRGRAGRWYEPETGLRVASASGTPIQIPSCLELQFPGYDGVAWYFRQFELRSAPPNAVATLTFGAVNYFCEVWLNGCYAGSHEGGYTPFQFEVTPYLSGVGTNVLCVRVLDVGRGEIDGLELSSVPAGKETWLYNFGGIWQDVRLLLRGPMWIEDTFVLPDIRAMSIRVRVVLACVPGECQQTHLDAWVSEKSGGRIVSRHESLPALFAGSHTLWLQLSMSGAELWYPESPCLYALHARLGEGGDRGLETEVAFGMRELTADNRSFLLNGRRYPLRGCLTQGYFPITLASPTSGEMARREFELIKKAGLNFLRLHVKTAHPSALSIADELGILLYEEAPIGWVKESAHMWRRCSQEVQEMIRRDRNHPSIVMWGILNEHSDAQNIRHGLAHLAHVLDPTRMVVDDSGGWSGQTRAYLPGAQPPVPILDLHVYRKHPLGDDDESGLRNLGSEEALTFVSEYGYGGMQDLESVRDELQSNSPRGDLEDVVDAQRAVAQLTAHFQRWSLHSIFPDLSSLCRSIQDAEAEAHVQQTQALRLNPRVSGYCFTALAAAGWEQHGLLDVWRRPKAMYHAAKRAHAVPYLALDTPTPSFWLDEWVSIHITCIDCAQVSQTGTLRVLIRGPEREILEERTEHVRVADRIDDLLHLRTRIGDEAGRHTVEATLTLGSGDVCGSCTLWGLRGATLEGARLQGPKPPQELDAFFRLHRIDYRQSRGEETATYVLPELVLGKRAAGAHDDPCVERYLGMVQRGATLLVLGIRSEQEVSAHGCRYGGSLFGQPADVFLSEGNHNGAFVPSFHWVEEHPILDGLPTRCLMGQEYRNICPSLALASMPPEHTYAGCLRGFSRDMTIMSGGELGVVPYGRGEIVLSQFELVKWLGKDPAADVVMGNMIAYAGRRSRGKP